MRGSIAESQAQKDREIGSGVALAPEATLHELPRPRARPKADRIGALDFARGIAILLMIQSHGVKGLLGFEQIPAYGLVPIHLITKFSSSLFILVFGMALAVAFLPKAGTSEWPKYRNRLLIRGLVVLFWYKLLTVVEMLHLNPPEEIVNALLYRSFPVFVEILGFYGLALLWVPFTLPVWKRMPLALKIAAPVGFGVIWYSLSRTHLFWGNIPLRAILLEEEGLYVWGQLSRGPLIFAGLLVGELMLFLRARPRGSAKVVGAFALFAGLLALGFLAMVPPDARTQALVEIAHNKGKHPPAPEFMLFSLSGAFAILSLVFLGGNRLASWLRPVTMIGKNALAAFVFHIFVIFLFYRYLFQLWRLVTYEDALLLTGALMVMTAVWVRAKRFAGAGS